MILEEIIALFRSEKMVESAELKSSKEMERANKTITDLRDKIRKLTKELKVVIQVVCKKVHFLRLHVHTDPPAGQKVVYM